jgi:hypothetical protein
LRFKLKKHSSKNQKETKEFRTKNGFLIFLMGCSFIAPVVLIYIYSYSPYSYTIAGFEAKKLVLKNQNLNEEKSSNKLDSGTFNINSAFLKDTIIITKNGNLLIDSIKSVNFFSRDSSTIFHQRRNLNSDSVKHKVMIMGDSECGGLTHQLNNYCIQNNHELVASLVWNSATIYNFGYSDTIEKLLKKFEPTYLFFVVGLNEMYAKDLNKRKDAAIRLLSKIKRFQYIWIGPANYIEDKGINKIFESVNDSGCFFSTKGMNLPKGSDGRHPSGNGYKLWMDSIANWINLKAKHKISMLKPNKKSYPFKSKILILNAAKFRGY